MLGSDIRTSKLMDTVGCEIGPETVLTDDQVYDIAGNYNDRFTSRSQAYQECIVDCALACLTYAEANKVMNAVNRLTRVGKE